MSLIYFFAVSRQGCRNFTMWTSMLLIYILCKADAMLVQRRNIDVEKKLWILLCSYNFVLTLYWPCHYNIPDMLQGEFYRRFRQLYYNIVIWCGSINVMKMLRTWRQDFNIAANLLSNIAATLKERCNSDVGVSLSLQCCILVAQHFYLTTALSQRFVFAGN